MKIKKNPKFVVSAVKKSDYPNSQYSEFAFIGRSNVGKSSLINKLIGAKIARTSNTPGRTRQINFISIDDKEHFVDLPGYGYAKLSKQERVGWDKLMYDYFASRENLRLILLLIDSRRGLMEIDKEFIDFALSFNKHKIQIVLTKCDKLNSKEFNEVVSNTQNEISKYELVNNSVISVSTKSNLGISELEKIICFSNS